MAISVKLYDIYRYKISTSHGSTFCKNGNFNKSKNFNFAINYQIIY